MFPAGPAAVRSSRPYSALVRRLVPLSSALSLAGPSPGPLITEPHQATSHAGNREPWLDCWRRRHDGYALLNTPVLNRTVQRYGEAMSTWAPAAALEALIEEDTVDAYSEDEPSHRLLDLPLPEPAPEGSQWIEAYRYWAH
jgi:hypothetical protein